MLSSSTTRIFRPSKRDRAWASSACFMRSRRQWWNFDPALEPARITGDLEWAIELPPGGRGQRAWRPNPAAAAGDRGTSALFDEWLRGLRPHKMSLPARAAGLPGGTSVAYAEPLIDLLRRPCGFRGRSIHMRATGNSFEELRRHLQAVALRLVVVDPELRLPPWSRTPAIFSHRCLALVLAVVVSPRTPRLSQFDLK